MTEPTETTKSYVFFIPGIPRSTQTGSIIRPGGGKRAFPTYRNTPWSSYCRLVAMQARGRDGTTLQGPLSIELIFMLPRPKKPKSLRPMTKPDLDNLEKKLLDGWSGILWTDDAQVVEKTSRKFYAGEKGPGLYVRVREI